MVRLASFISTICAATPGLESSGDLLGVLPQVIQRCAFGAVIRIEYPVIILLSEPDQKCPLSIGFVAKQIRTGSDSEWVLCVVKNTETNDQAPSRYRSRF